MSTRKLAVVTGGSSGIGYELARQFVEHDFDVLIAADDDGVFTASQQLKAGGSSVRGIQVDLSEPLGVEQLISEIAADGRDVDAIALNAGIGNGGAFTEIAWEAEQRLIGVNISSTVQLAKSVLPSMLRRGQGWMLFTASVAATMPGPYYATYAASKAFVLSFAQALRHEAKDSGVTITALMPGPTDTNFFDRADMGDTPIYDTAKDAPADVARDGFNALMAGKDHVVAGSIKNRAQTAAGKFMTDPMKAATHAKMTEPQTQDGDHS
jgi:short-subunit dehydrogenase